MQIRKNFTEQSTTAQSPTHKPNAGQLCRECQRYTKPKEVF